jgi:flagellar biosynthesis/type III secretory pathway M-ring protein FliF/YscJ
MPAKPQGPMKWPPDRNTLLIGGGAAALLIGAAFLAAMMVRKGRSKASASIEKALPSGDAQGSATGEAGGSIEKQLETKLAERDAMQAQLEAQALKSLQIAPVITKTAEVLAKHLREKIKAEPDVSAQVLRTWISETDE